MIKYQDLINGPSLYSDRFEFKLIQGNITSGSLATPGAKTIGIRPCPPGVSGSNTNYYIRISGGTGTAESVLVTGGTAASEGDFGTLQFTTVNSHTGNWHIESATAGISEAIWTMESGVGGTVLIPAGTLPIYAPVKRRTGMAIWLKGAGETSTVLSVSQDFPNSAATAVLDWTPGDALAVSEGGASDFSIQFVQPDSALIGDYTHWKPAIDVTGTYHTIWENIQLVRCWDGIAMLGNTNGATFRNVIASNFHYMFNLEGRSFDTVRIENAHSSTLGLSLANQISVFLAAGTNNIGFYIGALDDLKISNSTIGTALCASFHSKDGLGTAGMISNLWCEGNISISNGMLKFANLTMAGSGSIPLISQTGGMVHIVNGTCLYVGSNAAIYAGITGNSSSAAGTYPPGLSISNSRIDTQGFDITALSGFAGSPYSGSVYFNLSNVQFFRNAGVSYSTSAVSILNGTGTCYLTANGNRISPNGGGTGNGINIADDVAHVISDNDGGGYSATLPATMANMQWFANNNFSSNVHRLHDPVRIASRLSPSTFAPLQTENYIASETGSNNAIAGALLDAAGTAVPVATGLLVTVKLAHTLQAGANTFNLNAGGAVNIKSSRNPANNIATAYAATGSIVLLYDGTQWVDVSQ